jgi:hypothetical protein
MTFYSFLKKMPLHEVAKFSESCRIMQKKKNFESFKEWLSNQWDVWKHAKDKGSVDKALTYWHQDVEDPTSASAYLQNEPETVPETQPTVIEPHEQILVVRDGKLVPLDGFVFKSDGASYKPKKSVSFKNPNTKPSFTYKTPSTGTQSEPCAHCKDKGHPVFRCPQFQTLSQKARYTIVKENKLCLRCLRGGHFARECKVVYVCDVNGCGRKHNRLLHQDKPNPIYYTLHALQGIEILDDESDE